jgi:hypothetical protein
MASAIKRWFKNPIPLFDPRIFQDVTPRPLATGVEKECYEFSKFES